MKTFWKRTISATIYALLFIGTLYANKWTHSHAIGTIIFGAFTLFVTIGCTFEFFRLIKQQNAQPTKWLGYALSGLTVLLTVAMSVECILDDNAPIKALIVIIPIPFVALPLSLIFQLWKHSEQPFRDALYTFLPTLYAAIPLSYMTLIAEIDRNLVLMLLIMIWVNDSGAYIGGSWLGRHKLWPRHSPGKTWEGTIFGAICTVLVGCIVGALLRGNVPISFWVILALICSIVGTLGDLVESMFKRSIGVKDSGNIMPGHGGFLDRFDSLLMILPFAFFIIMMFLV